MTSSRVGGIACTSVDGVTVLSQPAPGPLRAVLTFRVGQADETLPTRGVTHLVEHLALTATTKGPHAFNGFTGDVTTSFVVAGEADEVTSHLGAVCRALGDLPAGRLEHERSILRTEAAGGGGAFAKSLASWRWGPRGFGLLGYEELGVPGLSLDQVQAWARDCFTPAQAVLWLSGSIPADLCLPLPGNEVTQPRATPCLEAIERLPATYSLTDRGVAMSYLAPRRSAGVGFLFVLQRRLMARLRDELGVSYGVQPALERITAGSSLHTILADCMPENASAVQDAVVEVLQQLRSSPATTQEVADYLGTAALAAQDEGARALAHVDYVARQLLLGGEVLTVEAIEEEQRQVTAEAIMDIAESAMSTLLLAVPDATRVPSELAEPCLVWSEQSIAGRQYRPSGARQSSVAERLTVGPQGVTAQFPAGLVTVKFAECAGMLRAEGGTRSLIGFDGLHVVCDPADWRDAAALPAVLDHAVPTELWMEPGTSTAQAVSPAVVVKAGAEPSRWRRALSGAGIALGVGALFNLMRMLGLTGASEPTEPNPLPPLSADYSDNEGGSRMELIADGQCLQSILQPQVGMVDPVGCNNLHVTEVIAALGRTKERGTAISSACAREATKVLTPAARRSVTIRAVVDGVGDALVYCVAQVPPGQTLSGPLERN